ncbi:MAG: isoprenylcysteine carboxylmethyltransferase family protein [Sphingomonas sp.]|uniref:methyltransferase family protein n=1 Tax=Sphingomonas sp. TaxID=28214 RepID=UPI0025FE94EA|nr:isoprenylcysteine carboxylmethyltransferase family protein [Sphingomonas sp.]MBX3563702.1 isoprenylcysteine carboxylmethyltransferase family protein [Sphingomonas sp.]
MLTPDADSPRIKFPPPLAFIGTLLAGWALEGWIGYPAIPVIPYRTLHTFGMIALVLGAAIILTAQGLFLRFKTDSRPWKSDSNLIVEGVYKWSRNPMYLGMALVYLGITMLNDSGTQLCLLLPLLFVIQKEVIEPEEGYLTSRFGARYLDYKAQVRRWI